MPRQALVGTLGALAFNLLGGCASEESPASSPTMVSDSAGVTIVANDLAALDVTCSVDPIPSLVIGDREDDEGHQLFRVFGATVLADGRIAVVNQGSQELRFYSPEGDFLHGVGGEGDGPGEFRNAFLLSNLPGDTLWVGDYRPWEYEVFGPDGTWLRQVRPEPAYPNPPNGSGLLSDGRMILASNDFTERAATFSTTHLFLSLHDRDGSFVDTLRVLKNARFGQTVDDPRSVWLYPWFESFAEFTAAGSFFVEGHGEVAELRVHDMNADGELVLIVRWSGQDLAIADEDVDAAKQALRDQYADLDPGMRQQLLEPLIHDDRPIAERFPAFINLFVGRDGDLWVKEYPKPGAPDDNSWIRFNSDGRFDCQAQLPSGLEAYEFGSGYVIGKVRNDLGVEQVVVHSIVEG